MGFFWGTILQGQKSSPALRYPKIYSTSRARCPRDNGERKSLKNEDNPLTDRRPYEESARQKVGQVGKFSCALSLGTPNSRLWDPNTWKQLVDAGFPAEAIEGVGTLRSMEMVQGLTA